MYAPNRSPGTSQAHTGSTTTSHERRIEYPLRTDPRTIFWTSYHPSFTSPGFPSAPTSTALTTCTPSPSAKGAVYAWLAPVGSVPSSV